MYPIVIRFGELFGYAYWVFAAAFLISIILFFRNEEKAANENTEAAMETVFLLGAAGVFGMLIAVHVRMTALAASDLHTYGLMVAAGFLAALTYARFEAVRVGEDPDRVLDLCFYLLIAAIVGARLFFVFSNFRSYLENPVEIFRVWRGGLVFYGGFILAVIVGIVYVRRNRMPIWKTADILAPGIALGHFFGRMGCFFAGCCYGKACTLPWAVIFTHRESLAPLMTPLHPTQLYSAFANLMIFSILWIWRTRKRFDGQIFWVYVLLYAAARFTIEFYRGDDRGGYWLGGLSVSQIIAVFFFLVAAGMLFRLAKRKGDGPQKTERVTIGRPSAAVKTRRRSQPS